MSFTAWYVPALPPQTSNPTKHGFPTHASAWEYAVRHFCSMCRKEEDRGEVSGCACEWEIEEMK